MAITFESKKYKTIVTDSNTIIGVLGDYHDFLKSLEGDTVYIFNGMHNITNIDFHRDDLEEYRKLLNIDDIIKKNNSELSHSERRILGYYLMIDNKAKIMVIDEPYLDLDYNDIKIANQIMNELVKNGKTVIVGSVDTNVIYYLCKKVLIIKNNNMLYGDVSLLNDKEILDKYHLDMPNIVEFIEYAKEKNIKIPYSKDIRDLIKDVYRNVSKRKD